MAKPETPQKNNRSGHATQIVVAVITTLGILGTAIFGNWDKIFPGKSNVAIEGGVSGSVAANTDKQQQLAGDISGVWKTAVMGSPYADNVLYSLIFQFERVGDRVFGLVKTSDRRSGRESRLGIRQGRIEGNVVTFITQSTYTDGQDLIPFQTEYHGIIEQNQIKFIRQNNVPGGGIMEKFIAKRG